MKKNTLLTLLLVFMSNGIFLIGQDIEIAGKAKIFVMDPSPNADSLVVLLPDNTLGIRDLFEPTFQSFFMQSGGPGILDTLTGFLENDSFCSVGRIDIKSYNVIAKCQAIPSNKLWLGYVEGDVFCNFHCFKYK